VYHAWERNNAYRLLVGKPEGKRPLGRLGLDMSIILKCNLKKWNGRIWIRLIWFRLGTSGEFL
jgi:hypothetical protein